MLDTLAAEVALDRWCENVQSICGRFQTRTGKDIQKFKGSIEAYSALGLKYASIETNAQALFRNRADVAADGDYYFLVYQARGRSEISQSGYSAALSPGDMTIVQSGKPLEIVHCGLIRHLSFHLPRTIVQRGFGSGDIPTARRLASESAVSSLVTGFLQQVHCRSTDLSTIPSSALTEALAALLVPLLVQPDADPRAGMPPELHAVADINVRRYVDANLRSPSISPRSVARAIGCSVRHVHRAFEPTGTTILSYVRVKRLEACATELSDPAWAHETVTDIALRWGFSEVSHFSRSFKQHFGISPREYRMNCLTPEATEIPTEQCTGIGDTVRCYQHHS